MLITDALDQEMRAASARTKTSPTAEERCDLLEKQVEYLSDLLNAVMAGTSNSLRALEESAGIEPNFRPWEVGEPYSWLTTRARKKAKA